ncbi:hypothetical protein RB195_002307 [Necator americanus]
MKSLSWEERGIRVDGRFLSNLRFVDSIVLFSRSTNEAETMLNELNKAEKKIGLRISRKKEQLMKNGYCENEDVQLEGSQIVETSSYIYLGRSMNMENDLKEKLNRRMRAALAAFAPVRSYRPTNGPRSSCPSVQLDSSSSALLRSGDVDKHRGHV